MCVCILNLEVWSSDIRQKTHGLFGDLFMIIMFDSACLSEVWTFQLRMYGACPLNFEVWIRVPIVADLFFFKKAQSVSRLFIDFSNFWVVVIFWILSCFLWLWFTQAFFVSFVLILDVFYGCLFFILDVKKKAFSNAGIPVLQKNSLKTIGEKY